MEVTTTAMTAHGAHLGQDKFRLSSFPAMAATMPEPSIWVQRTHKVEDYRPLNHPL
jgi:hypothetical protein